MRFGFVVPSGGVADHIRFAEELEAVGWDAVFVADPLYGTDPWVSRAACAVRTEQGYFDIIVEGVTPSDDPKKATAIVRPLGDAGVTW